MKMILFFGFILSISVQANAKLGPVLAYDATSGYPLAGTPKPVSLNEAQAFCSNQGLRLPTIREWAEVVSQPCTQTFSEGCGLQMSETKFPGVWPYHSQDPKPVYFEMTDFRKQGFREILSASNESPNGIWFYYNNAQFQPFNKREIGLGQPSFWSSTEGYSSFGLTKASFSKLNGLMDEVHYSSTAYASKANVQCWVP